jgi:hypothetical protein
MVCLTGVKGIYKNLLCMRVCNGFFSECRACAWAFERVSMSACVQADGRAGGLLSVIMTCVVLANMQKILH